MYKMRQGQMCFVLAELRQNIIRFVKNDDFHINRPLENAGCALILCGNAVISHKNLKTHQIGLNYFTE